MGVKDMTFANLKVAALKSLEDFNSPVSAKQLGEHAKEKGYFSGGLGNYSWSFVLSYLYGDGDGRIGREKDEKGKCAYYLKSKKEEMERLDKENTENETSGDSKSPKTKYHEKDLHKLLVSYLKSEENIYAKTVDHTRTLDKNESNQQWTHPDIVGVKLSRLKETAKDFLKKINVVDTFDICSYELKTEIKGDGYLKKCYFEAVSNSSWANYGYLVAFEIDDKLFDELKRLNKSFGIGFIKLSVDDCIIKGKIICPAKKKRNLDFDMIDKLCKNPDFSSFIECVKNTVSTNEKGVPDTSLKAYKWDEYFEVTDCEGIRKHCEKYNIPINYDNYEDEE